MCNNATKRFRLVEVPTDTVKQEYSLGKEEVLQDSKRIIAIEAFKVGTLSLSPDARALVSDTIFNKAYLTISTPDSTEVIYKIPLSDLNRAGNNGQLFYVDIPTIAPSKCTIKVATTAGISTAESFVLGFHYEK